jgi:type I restriction enzyme S subunit
MNPSQLLTYFDRICEAPDAVSRLRRFILDLAVRGKLIEQDPKDEPASELLKRIQAEKGRLVKEGKINLEKPPTPTSPEDLAFELRPKWQAVRISQILVELQTGPFGSSLHQSDYQKGGIPVINPASIKNERLVPIDRMAVGPATLKRLATFKLRAGDIVMARRGEMGRCAVVTELEEGWLCGTGSLILRLPSCLCARFFVFLIGSPFVREYLGGSAVGATMQNLNQSILLNLIVGLPPLAEQHRIVAKVDELMALCDRLEAARAERETRRDRLTVASIHCLNNGVRTELSREPASFCLNHLTHLTARPDQIKQIRQALLSLAIRGRLVPQHPADEPASESLKRIQSKKALLEKKGKIRSPKPLSSIPDDVLPFVLPRGWLWVRFGELIEDADAGWSPKSENFPRSGDNWGVLKVSAVSWNRFIPEENKQLLPGVVPPEAAQVHAGNFLISRANTSELVAKCVVVEQEPLNLILSDKIVRLHISENCSKHFLSMVNNHASHARAYYAEEASGTSFSMKNVSREVIYGLVIPLPPVAEQHRIVAKVDELMALCDQLEAQLTLMQDEKRNLLEAVLYHVLNNSHPGIGKGYAVQG